MTSVRDDTPPRGDTSCFLRQARDGDPVALEQAVRRLTPLLLAQADYRLRGRARNLMEPEDLVNETWLRTLPELRKLSMREGRITPVVLTYLSTTLRHRVRDLLLAADRRSVVQMIPADGDLADWLPEDTHGVVTRVVQAERHEELLRVISELKEEDREILVLRGIEQASTREVAVLLSLTEDTVKQRYHRALKRLKRALPGTVLDELGETETPE